jgi:phospholipase C
LYFNQYRNATPGNPLYDRARTGTNAKQGQGLFEILATDVQAGRLPQVAWIVAPEAFSEHPNWPANYGAWYIAQVLDALTAQPEVWSRTVLLITYDENDGFFDHIVPAYPPSSVEPGKSTWPWVRTCIRATRRVKRAHMAWANACRCSSSHPWSKGGWVCSEVFDHTSIVQFIERRFGVHEPHISAWRRAVCGDLTAAFDFGRAEQALPPLPDTGRYMPPDRDRHPDYHPNVPTNTAVPVQERGLRHARPIEHDLGHHDQLSRRPKANRSFSEQCAVWGAVPRGASGCAVPAHPPRTSQAIVAFASSVSVY